jgi:hypothetical protein
MIKRSMIDATWLAGVISTRVVVVMGAGVALVLTAPGVGAESRCRQVTGHYVEHATDPTGCPSPVGLCIEGEFSGSIRGAFGVTATSLTPTADTPVTAVVHFTGDGVIHARIGGKHGDFSFKSAGAFHTVGTGEIVDLQSITGGSGAFGGASGALRASGVFDPVTGSGESEYSGTVCLP